MGAMCPPESVNRLLTPSRCRTSAIRCPPCLGLSKVRSSRLIDSSSIKRQPLGDPFGHRAQLVPGERRELRAYVAGGASFELLLDDLATNDLGVEGVPLSMRSEVHVQVWDAATEHVGEAELRVRD